ncbi:Hypothetical_protein [Hexamita inflata]|uniref:Hypothetical_protein n=1 Tax=Hexamita inflata TaxID=28002 RepID=A0AA86TJ38_9EUKA|nr:Hypothetical protein HINF_LOCUS7889 [Hexamita inflata]
MQVICSLIGFSSQYRNPFHLQEGYPFKKAPNPLINDEPHFWVIYLYHNIVENSQNNDKYKLFMKVFCKTGFIYIGGPKIIGQPSYKWGRTPLINEIGLLYADFCSIFV